MPHLTHPTEELVDFNRILNGMIRALRLDKSFYEEVENDVSYSQGAWVVVIFASLAGAIGEIRLTLRFGYRSATCQ